MSLYMMWFDDSKKPTATKVAEGAAAYESHFHHAPLVVCVSLATVVEGTPLQVQPLRTVQVNNFWFGMELQRSTERAPQ